MFFNIPSTLKQGTDLLPFLLTTAHKPPTLADVGLVTDGEAKYPLTICPNFLCPISRNTATSTVRITSYVD